MLPLRNAHRNEPPSLPASGQLVNLGGRVLLTALKRAEEGAALIVRFVNQTPEAQAVTLSTHWGIRRAQRTDLRERPLEDLGVEDGRLTLTARPWEIVTLALE